MSDQSKEKTVIEKSRDVISQLKEMEHYSEENIEKLSEFWFLLEDKLKQKEFAERINELLNCQNNFQEKITSLIKDYDMYCNRIVNEGGK